MFHLLCRLFRECRCGADANISGIKLSTGKHEGVRDELHAGMATAHQDARLTFALIDQHEACRIARPDATLYFCHFIHGSIPDCVADGIAIAKIDEGNGAARLGGASE